MVDGAAPGARRRLSAKVLTVSTSVDAGEREDTSGAQLAERLEAAGFDVVARAVSCDGVEPVARAIREMAEGFRGLLVTTGGTGFSPTDLTPEATSAVIEREAPGIAEAMRGANPLGRLGRGLAGTIGRCLVLNTPGSARGSVESLDAVLDVLPHALELLAGGKPH